MQDRVTYYLQRLRDTGDEDAYFALKHEGLAAIPALIRAYHEEPDPGLRASLVELIWQHRLESTLDFLAEALQDEHPEVWKAALNGIVTIGGPMGLQVLDKEKERLAGQRDRDSSMRREWIEEAIEQINEG